MPGRQITNRTASVPLFDLQMLQMVIYGLGPQGTLLAWLKMVLMVLPRTIGAKERPRETRSYSSWQHLRPNLMMAVVTRDWHPETWPGSLPSFPPFCSIEHLLNNRLTAKNRAQQWVTSLWVLHPGYPLLHNKPPQSLVASNNNALLPLPVWWVDAAQLGGFLSQILLCFYSQITAGVGVIWRSGWGGSLGGFLSHCCWLVLAVS